MACLLREFVCVCGLAATACSVARSASGFVQVIWTTPRASIFSTTLCTARQMLVICASNMSCAQQSEAGGEPRPEANERASQTYRLLSARFEVQHRVDLR